MQWAAPPGAAFSFDCDSRVILLAMLRVIEDRRAAVESLCRKHGVKRLELFGSAARGDLTATDLDFFVEFVDYGSSTIADQWFGLQEDLQKLLGKPVDLISLRT